MATADLLAQLHDSIGDRYALESELARGGMSRVFVAEERALGRKVAIKVLEPELAEGISGDRFAREVRLAARLQHPNVVPLLTAGEAGGHPYYAMPLVAGQSLRARLERGDPLSTREAMAILRDVARALAYAHDEGIVHRDIKPENILLSGEAAVVTDFGIAKAVRACCELMNEMMLTQVGTSLGTPAYMAPEQAAGDPDADHRTDIYAWGVVAYEMLAGAHPFTARTPHEMVRAHMTETPRPLRERRPDVPAPLAAVVERSLAKNPEARPATATELLRALDDVVVAADAPLIAPATTRLASRKVRPLVAAFVLAVAAVVVLVALGPWRQRSPAVDPSAVRADAIQIRTPDDAGADSPTARRAAGAVAEIVQGFNWARVLAPGESGAATVLVPVVDGAGASATVGYRVIDAASGRELRRIPAAAVGDTAALRLAAERAAVAAGFASHPRLGPELLPLELPRADAFREYASAMQRALRGDTASLNGFARGLERAWTLDTAFTQAALVWAVSVRLSALATNEEVVTARRDSLLRVAEQRRDRLAPTELVLADLARADAAGIIEGELTALRQLVRLAPRSNFAVRLGNALLDANRPREAMPVLDSMFEVSRRTGDGDTASLRRSHATARADLLHYLGDDGGALAVLATVAESQRDLGVLRAEMIAHIGRGDTAAAMRLLDDVQSMPASERFFVFAGETYLQVGQEMIAHGHPTLGRRVLQRGLDWYRSRSPAEQADGNIRLRAALTAQALGLADESLAIARLRFAEDTTEVRALGQIGVASAMRGDTATARRMMRRLASMPAHRMAGVPTFQRANIAAVLGARDEAIALLRESFAQGQGYSIRRRIHYFTQWLPYANDPEFRELVAPKG